MSQIAFTTFERGEYFFKRQTIEQYVIDFLCPLSTLNNRLEPEEIDSEAVLKSIEAQHGLLVERARGVYSFSHLTFHEYFTAKNITKKSGTQLEEALQALVSHVTHKEWREVFLLTVSLLKSADVLLLMMKAQIDGTISSDEHLQKFLTWLDEKARAIASTFSPATVRAHYSYLSTGRPLARVIARAVSNDPGSELARANDFDTSSDIFINRIRSISGDFSSVIANTNSFVGAIVIAMDIANKLLCI